MRVTAAPRTTSEFSPPALATCCCNDLYRESAARSVSVQDVCVEVEAQFGGVGEPARQIRYRVKVIADAPPEAIQQLVEHTDRIAEVHNTLRSGIAVELSGIEHASPSLVRSA